MGQTSKRKRGQGNCRFGPSALSRGGPLSGSWRALRQGGPRPGALALLPLPQGRAAAGSRFARPARVLASLRTRAGTAGRCAALRQGGGATRARSQAALPECSPCEAAQGISTSRNNRRQRWTDGKPANEATAQRDVEIPVATSRPLLTLIKTPARALGARARDRYGALPRASALMEGDTPSKPSPPGLR